MEKSENVSQLPMTSARKSGQAPIVEPIPFAGLGFDLRRILVRRVVVMKIGERLAPCATPPCDTPLPSGRRLQISLGREIRGR